ncbi:MAG: beta-galactosidase [Candidatus Nealsonbacteria bacterium]|nr:beta-galactosidase [Candidatus Nealsonbacteria bacterium]
MVLALIIAFWVVVFYFLLGFPKAAEKIRWGVSFSQLHAQNLGLDWKQAYLAILDDLKAREIRIGTHWNLLEPKEGEFNFSDLDWQIDEAEKRNAKIVLVFGLKTPRWPECHVPQWASNISQEKLGEKVLKLVEEVVKRYESKNSIWAWQVENEPFFGFGSCPKTDNTLLKKEIDLTKSLDFRKRPIIITDTGEFSLWFRPAGLGDIVGVTMYKKVWSNEWKRYFSVPLPPAFYWRKANLVKRVFNKDVICVELQAEPWVPNQLYDSTVEEEMKTMDFSQFKYNIEFAKSTGLDSFYLWGAEWWYQMKEKQNRPEFWDEAKKLFE